MKANKTLVEWMAALTMLVLGASAPAQTNLTNGLAAYYPFNGNANDASGNGNNGAVNGAALTPDRYGNPNSAYLFNGVSDYIKVLSATANNLTNQFTISFWLNPSPGYGTPAGDDIHIISKWGGGGAGQASYQVGITPQGQLYTATYDGTQTTRISDPSVTTTGAWSQVVMVMDGTNCSLYRDSALLVSTNGMARPQSSVLNLDFGREEPQNYAYYAGGLDDIRIYSRALSSNEVAQLYAFESVPQSQSQSPITATAVPVVSGGFVVGATLTSGGSGYTNDPAVTFVGGNGSGAAATTIVSNGVVTGITIVNPGSGYTGAPSIVIAPPPYPPAQATGVAVETNGFVTSVTVTDQGFGYGTNAPSVYFFGGGGAGAAGFATVSNSVVTGVTMTSPGGGYTSAPGVLIAAPPGLPSLSITVYSVVVKMTLIPGYTYQLQNTMDFQTWINVGNPFLATNSFASQVFNVGATGTFFRLEQVP